VKVGSLFSGIGGLDLAVERAMGAETAWQVKYEPAPASILARHWPDADRFGDVTEIDWHEMEPVDVICGGYPCQPFSHAGLRKGTDDVRHLWPYFANAISVLRPRYAVLENVAGHLSLGFDQVLGDLAEIGYDATWVTLRAADIGAPHGRKRLFVLATDAEGTERRRTELKDLGEGPVPTPEPRERLGTPTDADEQGLQGSQSTQRRDVFARGARSAADADEFGLQGRKSTDGPRWSSASERALLGDRGVTAWGNYEPAIRRWEAVLGRAAPVPAIDGKLNARFVEWMMGFDEGWVDGLTRNKALKALGNAVVPQQGEVAIRLLVSRLGTEAAA